MTQSTINFYQGTAGRSEQFLYNNESAIVDAGDFDDYVQFSSALAYDQTVYGGLGFDIISTGFGNDTIFGDRPSDGDGDGSTNPDWITAGPGNDVVLGQSGEDYVNGDIGNDYIAGGAGKDLLQGGFGDDTVLGGAGDDRLIGGAVDPLTYGYSLSIVVSYDGISGLLLITPTTINGQPGLLTAIATGNDTLSGGDGNDKMSGQDGNDTLRGDAGVDFIEGGAGGDDIDGGSGFDFAFYEGSATGVTVNLALGIGQGGDAAGDTLTGIESLVGSGFVDNLIGSGGSESLYGGAGNDILIGGAGNDELQGGAGLDKLTGGTGRDTFYGGANKDIFDFNAINESVRGANRDKIMDLKRGQHDKIDVAGIDANTHKAGNQKFTFIGAQGFHDVKGELHYVKAGANLLVQGDVNGDGKADFEIFVLNVTAFAAGDFIL